MAFKSQFSNRFSDVIIGKPNDFFIKDMAKIVNDHQGKPSYADGLSDNPTIAEMEAYQKERIFKLNSLNANTILVQLDAGMSEQSLINKGYTSNQIDFAKNYNLQKQIAISLPNKQTTANGKQTVIAASTIQNPANDKLFLYIAGGVSLVLIILIIVFKKK